MACQDYKVVVKVKVLKLDVWNPWRHNRIAMVVTMSIKLTFLEYLLNWMCKIGGLKLWLPTVHRETESRTVFFRCVVAEYLLLVYFACRSSEIPFFFNLAIQLFFIQLLFSVFY